MSRCSLTPLAVLSALALVAADAEATPRYAMKVGQKCNLCHANPTGGGQRDPYATQYLLPTRLAMQLEGKEPAGHDPMLGENVTIGADLRTFFLRSTANGGRENFVEMQGSLYLKLQPDPRFAAYIHQDFGPRGFAEAWEVFGIAYVLPATGYAKVGRFVPAFGWKVTDHRSFTRRETVWLPGFPPHSDTGVEVGLNPKSFELNASVVNGAAQSAFDVDQQLAFVGRGAWRGGTSTVNVAAGGSYYYNDRTGEVFQAWGPFAGLRFGRLTWLGEFDWTRSDPTTSPRVSAFTTANEVSFEVVQGVDVFGAYDFHDPDVDVQSGSVQRVGGGLDALPYPFLAVRAAGHWYVVDEPPQGASGLPLDLTDEFREGHV
ncbi:MAG: hypothetical protein ACRDGR_03660, partial [bacterium]